MLNQAEFIHPEQAFRIHPFWFWNGDMEDAVIQEQIKEMYDHGVGGFFLCARQGMTVPYLSDKWFQKVRLAVETARTYGLHVWLYDEYPYPSGMAGGEVTLELPESKQYTLEHCVQAASGNELIQLELPWGRVLNASAIPVDAEGKRAWEQVLDISKHIGSLQTIPVYQQTGLTAYNHQRYFSYGPKKVLEWQAPEGSWEVHVFLEQEIEDFKYYGTFVDPCNPEAVRKFVQLTHERYAAELGEYFGGTIQGMFTDETGFVGRLPWSPPTSPSFY